MKKNLDKAVIYNVYPTSFYDSDGDGIGDLKGITEKLPYLAELADIVWINPIFVSPFRDGGYDIADYYAVDSRFGSMEDLKALFAEADRLGVKILLDLVAGHTSDEHPWFRESRKEGRNAYTDYYIWTDDIYGGYPYNLVTGNSERNGSYLLNAFYCQPALNFGFANTKYPWQFHYTADACKKVREEIVKIITFYLELGAAGFRVDMAGVMVKDDDGTCSAEVWKDIFTKVRQRFPDALFVAEWGEPYKSVCGECFDVDFFTHCYDQGYTGLFRSEPGTNALRGNGHSFFRREGLGEAETFFRYLKKNLSAVKEHGYVCIPSGNHDLPRISLGRDREELKVVYAFLFALPCVPLIYYGDEIGMPYENIPSKDGGYVRTGSRTPMRWSREENAGFSAAEEKNLYLPLLPCDPSVNAEDEARDPGLAVPLRAGAARAAQGKALSGGGCLLRDFKRGISPDHVAGERRVLRVHQSVGAAVPRPRRRHLSAVFPACGGAGGGDHPGRGFLCVGGVRRKANHRRRTELKFPFSGEKQGRGKNRAPCRMLACGGRFCFGKKIRVTCRASLRR